MKWNKLEVLKNFKINLNRVIVDQWFYYIPNINCLGSIFPDAEDLCGEGQQTTDSPHLVEGLPITLAM